MAEQFANRYSTTLASGYTSGGTSIQVTSATGAPGSGTFTLAILDGSGTFIVLFRVTSVSGTTFTGAAEGPDSSAASGSTVIGTILSAAAMAQIESDSGSSGYSPFKNLTPLVNSGWSWFNQGSSSIAFSGGIATMTVPSTGGDNCRGYVKSLPSTPWTVILGCIVTPGVIPPAASQGGGFFTGLMLGDGTKLITFDFGRTQNSNVGITLEIAQFNSATSFNSDTKNEPMQTTPPICWLKIHDDGTNRTYWFSVDPLNAGWTQIASEGNTTFLTPTVAGIITNVYNSASGSANFIGDAVVSFSITSP